MHCDILLSFFTLIFHLSLSSLDVEPQMWSLQLTTTMVNHLQWVYHYHIFTSCTLYCCSKYGMPICRTLAAGANKSFHV
ncbi:hypothetical protein CPB84DRAFT_1800998 [Gymnopilus junonius]|uniref:Secreted protein n=1 Tax=Gymnopilus junonius TaxID=109634 RepID=A0A9P5N845_GYMJU|nr:hypothetical protein CPB84DRAFT_1800998 [Gymnopilus junonius]